MPTGDNQTITYQRLCDRVLKLENDNILLKEQVSVLTAEIANLKQSTVSNTIKIQHFSDTFISETARLKSNIEVIEQLDGIDKIKE